MQRVGAGQLDVTRPRNVFGEVTAELRGNHDGVFAVDDESRRDDMREYVAHVGVGDHFDRSARFARRLRPVSGDIPPPAEVVVIGDAWRESPQDVEPLVDRIGI